MARRPRSDAPAVKLLHFRVTEREWQELQEVVKDFDGSTVASIVRDAVNSFVGDYREETIFRQASRKLR